MRKFFQLLVVIFISLGVVSCLPTSRDALSDRATPDIPLTRPITQPPDTTEYPLARSLMSGELTNTPEDVRAPLEQGQQDVIRLMLRLGEAGFMGPVFIPENAIEFHQDSVTWMQVAPEERLAGYLYMASKQQGSEALITLLVDYRQTEFYLGGNLAEAHLVRLPVGEFTVFEFALTQPLSPGIHDLVFMVSMDPFNDLVTRGVVEKQRRDGNAGFSVAGGYLRDKALALRRMVAVGDVSTSSAIPVQNILTFEPEQTDLLGVALQLSLLDDETDPSF